MMHLDTYILSSPRPRPEPTTDFGRAIVDLHAEAVVILMNDVNTMLYTKKLHEVTV